ncbi:MAG: cell division protein FtsQ/DivIB, partial [Candidatus Aenigmatarchaeota archaeon]
IVNDSRLELAFNLIENISKKKFFEQFKIKLINVTVPSSTYIVIDNTEIIIGNNNIGQKLEILERILEEKLNRDISLVKYIDLRYRRVYLGIKR